MCESSLVQQCMHITYNVHMVDKSIRHSMTSLYKTVYFKIILLKKKLMHGCNFTEQQIENNNRQLNIKMITLLVLNYQTRVQSEYYFSSDANVNVIEIKAPQTLRNTPPLLGAPKVIL